MFLPFHQFEIKLTNILFSGKRRKCNNVIYNHIRELNRNIHGPSKFKSAVLKEMHYITQPVIIYP